MLSGIFVNGLKKKCYLICLDEEKVPHNPNNWVAIDSRQSHYCV